MQNTDHDGSLKQQQTESGTSVTPVVTIPSTTFQQLTLAGQLQTLGGQSTLSVGMFLSHFVRYFSVK